MSKPTNAQVAEAEAALRQPFRADDPNLEVVDEPRNVSFVQSVRMSADLTRRLFKEAERRGITPSQLIRELVEAGLDETEQSAMVNVADVHRAIDSLSRKSA